MSPCGVSVKGREGKGTIGEITNVSEQHSSLDDAQAVVSELGHRFALYLRRYPAVSLRFNALPVDHRAAESHFAEYDIPPIKLEDGVEYPAKLTVIEWKTDAERA